MEPSRVYAAIASAPRPLAIRVNGSVSHACFQTEFAALRCIAF